MKNVIRMKSRMKGFSLVELVVVILIIAVLAVAVFAGGSASIRKAQVSRVSSDLHNFDIAMSTYMNENRSLVNLTNSDAKAEFDKEVQKLNAVLPVDYTFSTDTPDLSGTQFTMDASLIAYQSSKTDPWGNPYMLIIDTTDRNSGLSEYYLTTVSAGPNAQANLSGTLDVDDIFLLSQYSDGSVASQIYNMKEDKKDATGAPLTMGSSSFVTDGNNSAPKNIGETNISANGGTGSEINCNNKVYNITMRVSRDSSTSQYYDVKLSVSDMEGHTASSDLESKRTRSLNVVFLKSLNKIISYGDTALFPRVPQWVTTWNEAYNSRRDETWTDFFNNEITLTGSSEAVSALTDMDSTLADLGVGTYTLSVIPKV